MYGGRTRDYVRMLRFTRNPGSSRGFIAPFRPSMSVVPLRFVRAVIAGDRYERHKGH